MHHFQPWAVVEDKVSVLKPEKSQLARDDDLRPWRVICSVGGELSWCSSGGSGSGSVRQCISAQGRLYNLGTVECRLGLPSFEVPGRLIRQDILSGGQAECGIVVPELPNMRASGSGV